MTWSVAVHCSTALKWSHAPYCIDKVAKSKICVFALLIFITITLGWRENGVTLSGDGEKSKGKLEDLTSEYLCYL